MNLSRNKRIAEFLLFVLVLMASPCIVFGAKSDRESLKGMSGVLVNVSVDGNDTTLQTHGITKAMLKTDVEVKLRVASIKVFDDRNVPDFVRTGRPELSVSVSEIKFDPATTYTILITLSQDATLNRGKTPVRARTWIGMGWSAGGVDTAHENIRKILGDVIDPFINDYLAVNPK